MPLFNERSYNTLSSGFSPENLLAYARTRQKVLDQQEKKVPKGYQGHYSKKNGTLIMVSKTEDITSKKKKSKSASNKKSASKTKTSSKNSKNVTLTEAIKKVNASKKKRSHKYDDETGMIPATKNFKRDLLFNALPPGRRTSASGRVYYERRSNRCD